jgi:hypothetical protein
MSASPRVSSVNPNFGAPTPGDNGQGVGTGNVGTGEQIGQVLDALLRTINQKISLVRTGPVLTKFSSSKSSFHLTAGRATSKLKNQFGLSHDEFKSLCTFSIVDDAYNTISGVDSTDPEQWFVAVEIQLRKRFKKLP